MVIIFLIIIIIIVVIVDAVVAVGQEGHGLFVVIIVIIIVEEANGVGGHHDGWWSACKRVKNNLSPHPPRTKNEGGTHHPSSFFCCCFCCCCCDGRQRSITHRLNRKKIHGLARTNECTTAPNKFLHAGCAMLSVGQFHVLSSGQVWPYGLFCLCAPARMFRRTRNLLCRRELVLVPHSSQAYGQVPAGFVWIFLRNKREEARDEARQ
jgi:hypothetical protein